MSYRTKILYIVTFQGGFYILAALWGSIIACGKSFYDVNKTAGKSYTLIFHLEEGYGITPKMTRNIWIFWDFFILFNYQELAHSCLELKNTHPFDFNFLIRAFLEPYLFFYFDP